MNWLLPRLMAAALAAVVGGALGYVIGGAMRAPQLGVLTGSVVAVVALAAFDTLRAYRLIRWLSGSQEQQAPRDTGLWGEIGYRVERLIRLREQGTVHERTRLSQFLSAIEASPNGVLLLDGNDQIEWSNTVAATHFGLDPVRDLRQRVTNLVRSPSFVSYLQAGDFSQPVTVRNLLGRELLSVQVRLYGDGQKLVLSQDVSARERAEGMRRDFVANVSHEIRTPLTVLSGFIETMSDLPLTEVERRRVLTLMSQQTQRMQTLVSDLLTLAQLEGSPRPSSDQWVVVGKLIGRAQVDGVALSMARHQLQFPAEAPDQIAGAEAELMSALGNLVTNAVRYTPEGGRISVSWRVREDGSGVLSVQDTGLGIAREHIPRLTERFYRVDGSRSRDTGGTGLGLSIVKHVVQRHGGELDVTSELGKGSCFSLVFPPARVRRASGRSAGTTESASTEARAEPAGERHSRR